MEDPARFILCLRQSTEGISALTGPNIQSENGNWNLKIHIQDRQAASRWINKHKDYQAEGTTPGCTTADGRRNSRRRNNNQKEQ